MNNTQKTICCLLLSTFVNLYTSFMRKRRILPKRTISLELLSMSADSGNLSSMSWTFLLPRHSQSLGTECSDDSGSGYKKMLGVALSFARSSVSWSVNRWCYDHVTLRDFKFSMPGQRVEYNQQNLFTTNPVRSSVWGVFLTLTEQQALWLTAIQSLMSFVVFSR